MRGWERPALPMPLGAMLAGGGGPRSEPWCLSAWLRPHGSRKGLAFQPRVLRMSSTTTGGGVGMVFGANKVLVCSVGCGGSGRARCHASTSLWVFLWLFFAAASKPPRAGDADDKQVSAERMKQGCASSAARPSHGRCLGFVSEPPSSFAFYFLHKHGICRSGRTFVTVKCHTAATGTGTDEKKKR